PNLQHGAATEGRATVQLNDDERGERDIPNQSCLRPALAAWQQREAPHWSERNRATTRAPPVPGVPFCGYSLTLRTARNASCGISTRPTFFIRFLPSFCFSSSLR